MTNSSIPTPVKPFILTTFESSGTVNQKDSQKWKILLPKSCSLRLCFVHGCEGPQLFYHFRVQASLNELWHCYQFLPLPWPCMQPLTLASPLKLYSWKLLVLNMLVVVMCMSLFKATWTDRHKNCCYWISSSTIPWNRPPSPNLMSFHFVDTSYSSGVFQSSSHDLVCMRCYSGDNKEPGNMINPCRKMTVTFTCQS